MIKITCDRCGRELPDLDMIGRVSITFETRGGSKIGPANPYKHKEFCPECIASIVGFAAWLADPEHEPEPEQEAAVFTVEPVEDPAENEEPEPAAAEAEEPEPVQEEKPAYTEVKEWPEPVKEEPKPEKKHTGGRTATATPEMFAKFREGVRKGMTNGQACEYAGFSPKSQTWVRKKAEQMYIDGII